MLRSPPLYVAALLLVFGLALGLVTDRWGLSAELVWAPERLAAVPKDIGPWHGTDEELGPRQARRAGLHAHLFRRYVHAETGESLAVLVACGRPGPVAAHSPDVCYGGIGFAPVGPRERRRLAVEGQSSAPELWAERYEKVGPALPEQLQVYYAWNDSGGWVAAESPRLSFARARLLYKLYVVRRLPRAAEAGGADPIPGLLRLLLPHLDRCLFEAD
jgi:hypothetical protein